MWVTRHWHAQAILTTSTETVLSKMLQSDKQTPAATNRDARAMAEPGVLTAMLNWYRAIPLSDVRRVRHKITLPTMYVWSDGDTALLEKGARDCRRYVSGHLPIRDPARDALDTQRATRRGRRPAARMARRPSRLSHRRYASCRRSREARSVGTTIRIISQITPGTITMTTTIIRMLVTTHP